MKLTKKLIPAIGMLTLSMVMLVTSSFAWFSMNDTVKATGMTVGAKGDQVYLQIVSGSGADIWKDQAGKALTSANAAIDKKVGLQPTNVMASATAEYVSGAGVWVSATGKTAENGDALNGYTVVTQTNEGPQYYLENAFSIRLDPTAGKTTASGPLKVAGVNFKGANAETGAFDIDDFGRCVSVFVTCGDKGQLYKQKGTNGKFEKVAGDDDLASTGGVFVDSTGAGVVVTVYVFFDGEHDNCTLAKLATATQNDTYSVEVSFTVA